MIKIRDLSVKLGDKQIFEHFNADLPENGIILIAGESGIGKTTLLRVLCGLQKPDRGSVYGLSNRRIAFAFQEPRLLEHISALKNVSIVSDKEKAESILTRLNLVNELHLKAGALSGGQKQRVSIARAFAFSDDVVLLDEPFTGLDEQNKQRVADLIRTARLAVIVTHEAADVSLLNVDRKISL
jgi:ABC-type nitrate/sulfonate/bicarbonate transport system ATPase subunit